LQNEECITEAYWNKNDIYTLNTTRELNLIGIKFKYYDTIRERCYQVQKYEQRYKWLFRRQIKWRKPNIKLTYIGKVQRPGFIDNHQKIDGINLVNQTIGAHNAAIYLESRIIQKPPTGHNNAAHYEGQSIDMELIVENRSDTIQTIIWPTAQNDGQKIVYFEFSDKDGNHLFTESRGIGISHNETLTYGLLTLMPGERYVFLHTINGMCREGQERIACYHNIGALKEGEYKIKTWYNPSHINTVATDIWKPIGKDSVLFRYEQPLYIHRNLAYSRQLFNLPKEIIDTISLKDYAQEVYDIEVIGGAGEYIYYDGQSTYDGIGMITNVVKGESKIGDTIAFTNRYEYPKDEKSISRPLNREELIRQKIKNGEFGSYRIFATRSDAEFYIIMMDNKNSFMVDKINYQLINFPDSILSLKN
jgi:hypothetical protein